MIPIQFYEYLLGIQGVYILPYIIGRNGKLAGSLAVDEHEQLHFFGAAKRDHGVKRGADGAPGVKNVVDENDLLAFDEKRNARLARAWRLFASAEVVTVKRGVQVTERDFALQACRKELVDSLGEENAPWLQAKEYGLFKTSVIFN